jgi:hypothetical protein
VIVESIGGSAGSASNSIPITTMSQHHNLGPNVVFVNTSGGSSGVPFQVQQLLQQAQQQVTNKLQIPRSRGTARFPLSFFQQRIKNLNEIWREKRPC